MAKGKFNSLHTAGAGMTKAPLPPDDIIKKAIQDCYEAEGRYINKTDLYKYLPERHRRLSWATIIDRWRGEHGGQYFRTFCELAVVELQQAKNAASAAAATQHAALHAAVPVPE